MGKQGLVLTEVPGKLGHTGVSAREEISEMESVSVMVPDEVTLVLAAEVRAQ